MSFGKGFGIGLVVLLALNFVIILLAFLIQGTIDVFFNSLSEFALLGLYLTGSLYFPPSYYLFTLTSLLLDTIIGFETFTVGLIFGQFDESAFYILIIGWIATPIIASFMAGRMCESKMHAFGAWMVISFVAVAIQLIISIVFGSGSAEVNTIVVYLIIGLINGLFYSCFAMLASREDFF